MNIEEVINKLISEGGHRGKTAEPGSKDYDRAIDLDFKRCECSVRDSPGNGYDYIAKTVRGACVYVGISSRDKTISCGPKGYHYLNKTEPCI